jgi:hypothetical protein
MAKIVYSEDPLPSCSFALVMHSEEDEEQYQRNSSNGEVDIKYPSPRRVL